MSESTPHLTAHGKRSRCFCQMQICVCTPEEMFLRMVGSGKTELNQAMRLECLEQLDSFEGYSADDYRQSTNMELANAVLCAWCDYARSQLGI